MSKDRTPIVEGIRMEPVRLALDTILQNPTQGIPSWALFLMQHAYIERLAGVKPGDYQRDPETTYVHCQRAIGACMIDQFIPRNPLTMGNVGFEGAEKSATTGIEEIAIDGMLIDSPEAVVEHLEGIEFPKLQDQVSCFDENLRVAEIIAEEAEVQETIEPGILKAGYGFIRFPIFSYSQYGYENYFSAYALYPDVAERHFALQADLALLNNKAAARAYREGNLPPYFRLDFDMADSRGTLVSIESLDRMWFPHFARCLAPMLKTDVRMIWHCDGNLMEMVPRLLDVGIRGFQGFQYEDGMDYERICAMRTWDGESLLILGGVSVARTLPFGRPADVRRELKWLVEKGPPVGLFLGGSSSITPGVPWENIETLVEGLRYYREHGRGWARRL